MNITRGDGSPLYVDNAAEWRYAEIGGFAVKLSDGGFLRLSEEDADAIDELRDDGRKEADAGISAAHDAWERRRFLYETSRELFADLYRRMVDHSMAQKSKEYFVEEAAKMAANAAGSLLIQVHNAAATIRASGLDVA